jgi:hypothetical protein
MGEALTPRGIGLASPMRKSRIGKKGASQANGNRAAALHSRSPVVFASSVAACLTIMAATRKVRQGNVSSEPPASRGTEFPSYALPLILSRLASRGRSPDLLTLLAVCCVSREWKDAAEGDPELWREIDIPDCLHEKLTDERLISIVKRSKGRGLTLVDLNSCTNLTDNSVKAIQQNLPQLPQAVHLSYCTKVTWRSVIPLAKHILKQLNERERDRKNPESEPTSHSRHHKDA